MAKHTHQTPGKRDREQKRKERQAVKDAKQLAAVEARKEAALGGPPAVSVDGSEFK
jgi:hypothetical protein